MGRYAVRKALGGNHARAPSLIFTARMRCTSSLAGATSKTSTKCRTASDVSSAEIEPELLTNLFDDSREKRRMVRFQDLPKPMVDALLAAEDKRFFEHGGFDMFRIVGAAWADLRKGAVAQGASTLDMQVARSFFFSSERTFRRKIAETMVAFELDHRFTKQQIFELYSNEIYIGNRGSFAIRGFGEAAQAYFGKDIREINLAGSRVSCRHHPPAESLFHSRNASGARRGSARPRARADG